MSVPFRMSAKVRSNNEDRIISWLAPGRSLETLLTNVDPDPLASPHAESVYGLVVADGMGGVAGGEVASRKPLRFRIWSTSC